MGDNGWYDIDIRIRYKDTDRMGVVYYGNYLTFFEVGRTEFMRSRGIRYADLEALGYSLAVVETGAKYHGNVGYDALVTVRTRITQRGKARLGFDYEVFDQNGSLLFSHDPLCHHQPRHLCKERRSGAAAGVCHRARRHWYHLFYTDVAHV